MQLTISSGFCRKTEKPDLREECSEDVERARGGHCYFSLRALAARKSLHQLCSWDCKAAGKPAIGARRSKD
jgi:hypothetical protein